MSVRSKPSVCPKYASFCGSISTDILMRSRWTLMGRVATIALMASAISACSNGMARFDEATLLGANGAAGGQVAPVLTQQPQVAAFPQVNGYPQQAAVQQVAQYPMPPAVDATTTASIMGAQRGVVQSGVTLPPSPATAGVLRPRGAVGLRSLLPSGPRFGARAPQQIAMAPAAIAQTNDLYGRAQAAPAPALPARFPTNAQTVAGQPLPAVPQVQVPAAIDQFATASVAPATVTRAPLNPVRSARVAIGNGTTRLRRVGTSVLNRQPAEPIQAAKTGARLAPQQMPAPVQPALNRPAPVQQVAAAPRTVAPALPQAMPPQANTAIDNTITGTPVSGATSNTVRTWQGWSAAGGTAITARQGETVYNLSRRYGVPADAIIGVNGLGSGGMQANQRVIIPTYQFNRQAGVSAPDANSNVQASSSSLGWQSKLPAQVAPPRAAPDRMTVASIAPAPVRPVTASVAPARVAPIVSQPMPPKLAPAAAAPKPYTRPQQTQRVATAASGANYKVVSGDTVSAIARRYGVSSKSLMAHNGMSNANLRVGQKLSIPTGGVAALAGAPKPVKPTQTALAPRELQGNSGNIVTGSTPSAGVDPIITGSTKAVSPEATGISNLRWPVRGRVLHGFGATVDGKRNDGIDIAVPEGTSVKAAENGVVLYAGNELAGFGNLVLIKHEGGLVTAYAHNASLQVKRGQSVARGQTIARAGRSGDAKTPKVHFEVRKNSTPVNPMTYLGG